MRCARWLVALGLALLTACATTRAPVEAPVAPSYHDVLLARLNEASSTTRHALRYNPSPCACPAFEVFLGEHWTRVDLIGDDTDDPVVERLTAAARGRDDQTLQTFVVEGSLEETLATCATGKLYVTLDVTAFEPPPTE